MEIGSTWPAALAVSVLRGWEAGRGLGHPCLEMR